MTKEQEKNEFDTGLLESTGHVLVLCNDEVNTINFVINALVEVCKHETHQAEQCAMITHFNGKCDVKHGEFDYLLGLKRTLVDMGLTAVVEKN